MRTIQQLREFHGGYGILNQDVLKELEENRDLRLLWLAGLGPIVDDEIEPRHNPDWCKTHRKHEAKVLEKLKQKLAEFNDQK